MVSKDEAEFFLNKRVAVRFEDKGQTIVYFGQLTHVGDTSIIIRNATKQGLVALEKIVSIREEAF